MLSAVEDPRTFLFRLRYGKMVSYNMCKNLRAFASTQDGSQITRIVDIGANAGQFAWMARYCWPKAYIESYEPDPTAAALFRERHDHDNRVTLRVLAIGAEPGILKINRGSSSCQNSALMEFGQPDNGHFDCEVETLDRICKSNPDGRRLLKLDVQGFELQVLRGAEATLMASDYVLAEVSLADTYANGALIEEVWSLLRENGFIYQEVIDSYCDPLTGVVLQMDILYIRRR
jgi:FkbM family methyltransferase